MPASRKNHAIFLASGAPPEIITRMRPPRICITPSPTLANTAFLSMPKHGAVDQPKPLALLLSSPFLTDSSMALRNSVRLIPSAAVPLSTTAA